MFGCLVLCGLLLLVASSPFSTHDALPNTQHFTRSPASARASSLVLNAEHGRPLPRSPDPTTVARVDGEPIELAEFRDAMTEERVGFLQSYAGASRAQPAPLDLLKERALDALISRKLVQLIMKRHGLAPDITYSAFLARWDAENRRRADATAAGTPVYGPLKLSARDFFAYEFSNTLRELKLLLQRDDDHISFEDRFEALRASATVDVNDETYRSATID
jgi:hypothetical protein